MKYCTLILAVTLLTACQKSEIADKPAAEVSEAPVAAPTATQPAAGTKTNVVREKSSIKFVGAKVTRDHHGEFRSFDGWIEYAGGRPVNISFDIDLSSMVTDTEKLTEHLKSPDFFDVAKYPKATFVSTSLTAAPAGSPGGATHMLEGSLTMHGITKAVTIPVVAHQSAQGVHTTSEFTIDRHDWGISYKGMPDDLIKDEVLIKLDLTFPPPPAA